jgi:hypothetical protein
VNDRRVVNMREDKYRQSGDVRQKQAGRSVTGMNMAGKGTSMLHVAVRMDGTATDIDSAFYSPTLKI